MVVFRREAEGGKLRIGRDVAGRVNVFADQRSYIGIAAHKVVSKERMRRAALIFIRNIIHLRRQRFAIFI